MKYHGNHDPLVKRLFQLQLSPVDRQLMHLGPHLPAIFQNDQRKHRAAQLQTWRALFFPHMGLRGHYLIFPCRRSPSDITKEPPAYRTVVLTIEAFPQLPSLATGERRPASRWPQSALPCTSPQGAEKDSPGRRQERFLRLVAARLVRHRAKNRRPYFWPCRDEICSRSLRDKFTAKDR